MRRSLLPRRHLLRRSRDGRDPRAPPHRRGRREGGRRRARPPARAIRNPRSGPPTPRSPPHIGAGCCPCTGSSRASPGSPLSTRRARPDSRAGHVVHERDRTPLTKPPATRGVIVVSPPPPSFRRRVLPRLERVSSRPGYMSHSGGREPVPCVCPQSSRPLSRCPAPCGHRGQGPSARGREGEEGHDRRPSGCPRSTTSGRSVAWPSPS